MLEKYDTIVIARHKVPDLDALGSQIGLKMILKKEYPEKQVVAVGEIPEELGYFKKFQGDTSYNKENAVMVVLDTSTAERVEGLDQEMPKVIIDHHPAVENPGFENVLKMRINEDYSSTSEMLAEQCSLDSISADLLYRGVFGDTGAFQFNIKSRTFLNLHIINQYVDADAINKEMRTQTRKTFECRRETLKRAKSLKKINYCIFTQADLKMMNASSNDVAMHVNELGNIEGVEGWLMLIEQADGTIRARIRSANKAINDFASRYHGGGHSLASGAYLKTIDEVHDFIDAFANHFE